MVHANTLSPRVGERQDGRARTSSAPDDPRHSRRQMALGLGLSAAIVASAVIVGEKQGFARIGFGGINSSLLPKVGSAAPDIVTMVSDGRVVRLSDFRGQPVWLNFWGSWCPPCRAEMPDMQTAYQELEPRGLVMLAISLDEPPEVAFDYARRNGATYLVGTDPERKLTGTAYPIVNFPTHILIDQDGLIRSIILAELDAEQFIASADAILADDRAT